MRFKLNIQENLIQKDSVYNNDIFGEGKSFPVLTIGKDSYIEECVVDISVKHTHCQVLLVFFICVIYSLIYIPIDIVFKLLF